MPNITTSPLSAFAPRRIRFAAHEWFSGSYPWDVAATLTTKDNTTEQLAHSDLKHFWNLLDRNAYGNASKKGKRIKRICIIDRGANNTNVHYHIVALTPTDAMWTTDYFCGLMRSTWESLYHAGDHNTIGPIHSFGGAIGYLSKKFKSDLDGLDLVCSNFLKLDRV
jgi:hypothetical protein